MINGKFRTPKIEALGRAIDFINKKGIYNISKLGLDRNRIESNSWLSGFLDGDGSFNFYFKVGIIRGNCVNIQSNMRISQRANYIKGIKKESYLFVMKEIADFIGVNVKEIKRDRGVIIENNYEVRSVTISSREILIKYLGSYPLYSSKWLDAQAWIRVEVICRKRLNRTSEGTEELKRLKETMNTKRIHFTWGHLSTFYKD